MKSEKQKKSSEKEAFDLQTLARNTGINTDPQGSYTGNPADMYDDYPVQDADDL